MRKNTYFYLKSQVELAKGLFGMINYLKFNSQILYTILQWEAVDKFADRYYIKLAQMQID